jgi:hypothetical protein
VPTIQAPAIRYTYRYKRDKEYLFIKAIFGENKTRVQYKEVLRKNLIVTVLEQLLFKANRAVGTVHVQKSRYDSPPLVPRGDTYVQ